MRGEDTLIPARFLSLLGHLCVLITLLWESAQSVRHCLPSQYHNNYYETYHNRLVAGLAAALCLLVVEMGTFLSGLTMFSPFVSLISIGAHGSASILLTYFILDGWLCDWYWPVFCFCSLLPALFDPSAELQQLTAAGGYRAGWSFYLVLAGVAATVGSAVPVGYNIGVVNTPAKILKQFCNESIISHYEVELSDRWLDVLWASVVSTFIVGGCTGSLLGAYLADRLGRKYATIVTNILSVFGAAVFFFSRTANSVEMLILGRLVVGLAGGLTTSIVPMYLTELSPLRLSGPMGAVVPMGVNVGVLLGQVMGLRGLLGGEDNWHYLLSVYGLLVIISIPLVWILPESPKYLYVIRGDEAGAFKELGRLRGVSPSILQADQAGLRAESNGRRSWTLLQVARAPALRLALLLTVSMQAGQQTSGINAVFYYSQVIFEQAGLSATQSQYATIGCGAINVCTALLMLWLVPRAGRRPLLLGSLAAAAALLAGLAASMRFISAVPWMPYVCMTSVLAYVLVYGFGLGPIPYFIASEMFEVAPRSAAMALGSLGNWGGNFLVGMLFPSMRDALGAYSFLVFSVVTAALFVFQKMYFPETQGRTPSEIAQLTSRGFKSKPLEGFASV